MAGGSSKRACRQRRHARYGKPVYPKRPPWSLSAGVLIVDEVPGLMAGDDAPYGQRTAPLVTGEVAVGELGGSDATQG